MNNFKKKEQIIGETILMFQAACLIKTDLSENQLKQVSGIVHTLLNRVARDTVEATKLDWYTSPEDLGDPPTKEAIIYDKAVQNQQDLIKRFFDE